MRGRRTCGARPPWRPLMAPRCHDIRTGARPSVRCGDLPPSSEIPPCSVDLERQQQRSDPTCDAQCDVSRPGVTLECSLSSSLAPTDVIRPESRWVLTRRAGARPHWPAGRQSAANQRPVSLPGLAWC